MSNVSNDEVKTALEEMKKAHEEMKKVNDAKLEALKLERSGSEFDEKLSRISDVISKQEKTQRDFIRQQEAIEAKRAAEELEWKTKREQEERKFEARMNRHILGLGGTADEAKGLSIVEKKAYDTYLRKGMERMGDDERKVLVVSNDSTGGYLAPPTYLADIIKAAVLFSPMREIVNVRKIGTGQFKQPKRTQTAAATRVGEVASRSESQNPAWGMIEIQAPEMYAEARISMANLEDSAFDLEKELSDEFAEQFGVTEGNEVVNGNGVGKCHGFLDANAAGPSTPIAYTASGAAATIKGASGAEADGLVNLFHAVKTAYAVNGRWVLNRNSLGKVRLLKDTTGQYIWQPGIAGNAPATILGAPYTECPDMPDESAGAFPIAFGDWKRAYSLVERLEMSIVRDPFTVASSGQVKFSARRRVGGQVVLGEAIRLLKCATS